jgi:signal transduction histidine kinase
VYAGVLALCFAVGTLAGWTALAVRIDHYAYDLLTRISPAPSGPTHSVVVAIDEPTLRARGGMRNIRTILAETLEATANAHPAALAADLILSDRGDGAEDSRLEAAFRRIPNLVLDCDLAGGGWEDPLPRFASAAAAVGHIHPEIDRLDGVSRELPLEETANHQRRWALALEAFRVSRGQQILESPDDLQIGTTVIPAPRAGGDRPLLIRYRPEGIPTISALAVKQNMRALRGKVVFVGVTALSAARDRLLNPYGQNVPGVEVHAHAFETIASGRFLTRTGELTPLALSLLFTAGAGLAFGMLAGWSAYLAGAAVLALANIAPWLFFRRDLVLPYVGPVAVAWLATAGAATYQSIFVRRQLKRTESEKSRYQQAIHWAAHEMRTPLTAIQGSSEIMTNYSLPPAKQKQLSEMINSESKRLARLIQTFLDVERLAEGQMELKRAPLAAAEVVETCLKRIAPIAERKNIRVILDSPVDGTLMGDRELLEYAFYNLLTNAVKYSPPETRVSVAAERRGLELRLSVADQGMGMDAKELKSIFKKFYRTKRAEQSGEVGTGIGLSIVQQIVTVHGGRMEVASEPGKGSCFTMVLKLDAEAVNR